MKTISAAFVLAAASLVAAAPSTTTTASAPSYTYQPVHIVSQQNSSLCLGVTSATEGAGLSAQLCSDAFPFSPADLTVFTAAPWYARDILTLYASIASESPLCIAAPDALGTEPPILAPCNSTQTSEIWYAGFESYPTSSNTSTDVNIVANDAGNCITLGKGSFGAPATVYTCEPDLVKIQAWAVAAV